MKTPPYATHWHGLVRASRAAEPAVSRARQEDIRDLLPHGDYLHVFVADDERAPKLAMAPDSVEKLLCGGDVVGPRAEPAQAPPELVRQLLLQVWARKSPKQLVAALSRDGLAPSA